MKQSIMILMLCVFFSCSTERIFTVYPESTMKAAEFWAENEGHDFQYTDKINTADIRVLAIKSASFGPQGIYYAYGLMEVRNEFQSIAHEMGHYFGYDHSSNKDSIMFAYYTPESTNHVFMPGYSNNMIKSGHSDCILIKEATNYVF